MSELPTWIAVCLREPLDAAAVASRMHAATSRYGLAFPGGFLARIEQGPWPRRMLDTALAEQPIDVGAATLLISGGTNELERDLHRSDLAARQQIGVALEVVSPTARIESTASMKMRRLMDLVRSLAPLATAIVMPHANHLAYPIAQWMALGADYDDGYTFPLFSALKVRADVLASTGMWTFGVPDVAMAATAGQRDDHVRIVGLLQRELVAEGWWPRDGDQFDGRTLRAMWESIWIESADEDPVQRAQFERFAQLRKILGPSVHYFQGRDRAIEHFLREGQPSMAVTNGFSATRELSITSPRLGPWANDYLDRVALAFAGDREIKELDRIALGGDEPIAAVVPWSVGQLNPLRPGEPTVELWDLLPILPAELAEFRVRPGAQSEWIDARQQLGDFAKLHERWP
jgi:hypothetical protein